MKVVLASRNEGKLREIRSILTGPEIEWVSLCDFPSCPESEESGATYLHNARDKAVLTAEHTGCWALADDSGLEVEALNWQPGVRSARYAGKAGDDRANNARLLRELGSRPEAERRAVFRCILVLRDPRGQEFVANGELWGKIATLERGKEGFGYDPLFIPEGHAQTLAELGSGAKNRLSHRRCALEKLRQFLPILLK